MQVNYYNNFVNGIRIEKMIPMQSGNKRHQNLIDKRNKKNIEVS